eukprot:TRINITY_DN24436_c0_g1_i2.p1 TRINITY_DN24436_c0_g1~~TRINITY_DN24436_c0_g1_i2.p1  ORF type:complete len:221 (-),score=34.02 TRINITY_DN24436_c0_g1_i2:473-1135(-)
MGVVQPGVKQDAREKLAEALAAAGCVATLDSEDGKRLIQAMPESGCQAFQRWMEAWEEQIDGGSCGPASALAALRFLGLQSCWSQKSIMQQVVLPHQLFTKGISLAAGAEMMRILGSGRLHVEERCTSNDEEMSAVLQTDLNKAFQEGVGICILANYLRPSGGGHWSPLGGWSEGNVLILDTNARRLPAHWVTLSTMVQSLCQHNQITRRPRGYLVVRHA